MIGVYRFWRDSGLVAGALIAGVVADALGSGAAIALVAALTAASGLWVAVTRWAGPPARDGGDGERPADSSQPTDEPAVKAA